MQGTGSDGLWGPPVTSELLHARAISITTRLPYGRRRAGRIPKPAGPLIGREWELDAIRYALLHDDVRLLTLWGPAGIGKTRLALASATDPELARAFQDVVFVDLAPLTEANHVMPAIAEAFGLGDAPHPLLLDQLESVLNCRRVLLILDNFEHVLEFAPQLARLLANCPTVTILATSRAALQLRSERAFPVAPLAVPRSGSPTDAATAATYPAVALFAERARAARPDFELTDGNAAVVVELCARLDGLPLALELAAARTKGLPITVLFKRLDDRLRLLQSGALDLPVRQQTLRRALMWSYDLLDRDQQTAFARLSVFDGGCTPEAAEAVCADAGVDSDILESLATLVHHSLVRLEENAAGEPRYTMLATIRDFALEQLERSESADDTRHRHLAYYLHVAERAESQLWGPQQVQTLERLGREHANLRAGLRWAFESGATEHGLRLGAALWRFWSIRGHLTEGRSWLRQLLASPDADQAGGAHARALAAAGWLAVAQGDYAEAQRLQEHSLLASRRFAFDEGIANALRGLGVLAKYADRLDTARARLEESLAICRTIDFTEGTSRVIQDLGNLCIDQRDFGAAGDYFDQSLAIRRHVGDMRGIALAQFGLARVALGQGNLTQARALLGDSLGTLRHLQDHQSIAALLEVFACLVARDGGTARALRLVGAAESLRTAVGAQPAPYWRTDVEAHQIASRSELGPVASMAAHAEGRALAVEQAIQLCLEEQRFTRASAWPAHVALDDPLREFTRRERDVIELAVRGWSNRQIANQLVISERTAEGHIHNILGKLHIDSRAQLVAWGARLGLVSAERDGAGRGPAV
jgi:predicted ATPase/DNA-binding CsgD family transcriptional regulator